MFTILEGHKGYVKNKVTGMWEKETDDIVFAKVFSPLFPHGRPASLPFKFNVVDEVVPGNLSQMHDLMQRLTTNPELLAIRAKSKGSTLAIRRTRANFDVSERSTIVAMDIDDYPLPDGMDIFDIETQARFIIKILNSISEDMFPLNAGFIVHASSSAAIKSGIRIHLLLESNIPVSQGQLKFIFSSINESSREKYNINIIDLAYYSAVQAHYFADPIFESPMFDPFKKENISRLKYVVGDKISLPDNAPDYETTRGEFKEEFLTLLDSIKGKRTITERLEKILQELESCDDGVYLRIIPKLYHNALEEGIDLGWLEKEIRPIMDNYVCTKDNTRSVEDYFANGRKQALKAFVNNSKRDIPTNMKGVPLKQLDTNSAETEKFIKLQQLPPNNSMTFVKSSLGTGKTTAIVKWLESNYIKGGFLAITNTRALVASNAAKFGAGQYNRTLDMLDFKRGGVTRMSSTIHSIHKFKGMVDKVDFLFIDECDAVMNDLLFAPVVKQRRQCIETLRDIMLHAKHVVLSDGDVSAETVEAYGSLIDFDKPIFYYNHHRRMLQGAQAYEFPDENSVWVALQTSLDVGEKSILVSDCGPSELGEKGISLRNSTGALVKEIHSGSTADPDIRDILDRTNEALIEQKVDCLLCSPSVTNGVDWNYFDNVFVITKTSNQAPNMRFQAMRRDRGAKNIFLYTSNTTKGFIAGSEQYNAEEGWLDASQQIYAKRRELESRNYISTLRYYLLDQGAIVDIFTESWGKIDSAEKEYFEERVNAIMASTMDYTPLRHNDAFEAKMLAMQYYHIDKTAQITREDIENFVSGKPDKKAEFFHKTHDLFWKAIQACSNVNIGPFATALEKNKKDFFIRTGQSANKKYSKMYLRMMGIGEDMDTTNIVDWYRTYCYTQGVQLPPTFMTPDELARFNEGQADLGASNE